jgi:hypothetical protein
MGKASVWGCFSRAFVFVCLGGLSSFSGSASEIEGSKGDEAKTHAPFVKPNIVVILADDLGYGDVHCNYPDRGKIKTPNIDRLAAEGMRLTDGHCSSGLCSTSSGPLRGYKGDAWEGGHGMRANRTAG